MSSTWLELRNMLNQEQTQALEPKIAVARILVGAMMAGVVLFFVVLLLMNPRFTMKVGFLEVVGIVFALPTFIASFIAPLIMRRPVVTEIAKMMVTEGKNVVDDGMITRAFAGYQTILVIRCALIEGSTFLNLMIWRLEGSITGLIVALTGLALLAMQFPFSGKAIAAVESLIDDAEQTVQRDLVS